FRDIEFVRRLYRPLIIKCADFMVNFRHDELDLPKPSWNLWEDRRGIHTFTVSTVIGGLRAAANFARLFGETERAESYEKTAEEFVAGMREHLYSAELGRFLRALEFTGDEYFTADTAVGSSAFALFYFGAFSADDKTVKQTMRAVEEKLWVNTKIGGVARFESDGYMRVTHEVTGNPWFICTLWLADYRIAVAKSKKDLKGALEILEWTCERALPSGVLAEQVNPLTGEPVSVAPLTWSHSTFVATVMNYLKKLSELSEKA
ncbi:MAG: glycoside hydrolase family 15 protein, partial [Acidobacteriota bacterium]|nr:glycoside hydrolase family 15 protein [Acidobacteriota bacterium]